MTQEERQRNRIDVKPRKSYDYGNLEKVNLPRVRKSKVYVLPVFFHNHEDPNGVGR